MKTATAKTESAASGSSVSPFFRKGGSEGIYAAADTPFFHHQPVQTKLTIGQPNDKYEKEADAMADQVVQRLSNSETLQAKSKDPVTSVTPLVQAKCTACAEKERLLKKEEQLPKPDEEELQLKCAACEGIDEFQKKGNSNSGSFASPVIESSLSTTKGSGSALPYHTRSQMETAFGADFSHIRIHSNSSAVQLSKSLNAQAFTHGSDIYFNAGKYNPDSKGGQHLLAHELTHTMQQGASVSRTIQRTTHGRGGPMFTPTNCANPLIPLSARMAGVAAHGQIAATLSFLGIHPQAIPRATKRRMGTASPPFGTNLGFADLWTIAGNMARISEIKSTNIGHGRARTEARHYANRHNEWNLRSPFFLPDDIVYDALIRMEGGVHPIPGDILDLSGFTGTGLTIGPFIADPLKLLFIESDSQGAMVYWCQGPGAMNPLLILLLKKALDKLKKMLEGLKRILQDIIDSLPSPGEVLNAIAIALAVLLILAALVCMVIAILCLAGIVTAPCAALGIAGAVVAVGTALLLLGINIPGFTDGTDPIAAISNADISQPSTIPQAERELTESTLFAMATSVLSFPDPVSLALRAAPNLSVDQAKLTIQDIANTLEVAGEVSDAAFLRSSLTRIVSAEESTPDKLV